VEPLPSKSEKHVAGIFPLPSLPPILPSFLRELLTVTCPPFRNNSRMRFRGYLLFFFVLFRPNASRIAYLISLVYAGHPKPFTPLVLPISFPTEAFFISNRFPVLLLPMWPHCNRKVADYSYFSSNDHPGPYRVSPFLPNATLMFINPELAT